MSLVDGSIVWVKWMYHEEMEVESQLTGPETVKIMGPQVNADQML